MSHDDRECDELTNALIRIEDLQHAFGDVAVLDGVDLTVDPGEFVALVGPNGAGKTTLLRMLNGVLSPDAGTVILDGTPISELSSKAVSRRVATVPQDTHIGFSFTTEQIVEMGRTPHRSRLDWSDDSDPVERALERTETLEFRDRPVDDLSGGERQRVLLARALAQEPAALLLDEPTASLDINHQVQVLELVAGLVEEGKAALAAIHDLDLAARYCDRLVLLSDGKIRARGPPATVLTDEALETAFGTTTAVTHNPATGTPTVAAFTDRPSTGGRVHIAGGGNGTRRALAALWRAGFEVSVGLLPEGDSTLEIAQQFDCQTVTAPPFEPISETRREAAAELARNADVLVYSSGPGSEALAEVVDTSPCIYASLGEQSTADAGQPVPARGDGGLGSFGNDIAHVVETEQALLSTVRNCLNSD